MNYSIVTLAEVKTKIDYEQALMYDCETIGLYGKIRLAQFFQEGWAYPLLVENPEPLELVSVLSNAIVVAHNAHYDISCIQDNLGRLKWMPKNFHCTFLLSRLYFYNEEKFSLDAVIRYTIGHNPYGDTKKDLQQSDWSAPVLSKDQLTYAADDVRYLLHVWGKVKECMEDLSYKLDLLCLKYCLDFQNNGMPVDMEILQSIYAQNMADIAKIALPINCNSYQQVRKYIDSTMSDDLGLSTLAAQGSQKAADVKTTRKLTKSNSFLQKFADTAIDNVIFGKFKPSARSGRTTSDDQNLQQIPRALKSVFGFKKDGDQVIIFSDFAQIQLRGVCVVANDKTMEKLFRAGEDLHNFVAKMIFGDDFTTEDRQICKTANFGLLFGAGVIVFLSILLKQAGFVRSEEWGMKLKKKWIGLWTGIGAWQQAGIKAYKKGEAWETPLGRRYTARMMTDQLAMQIQGFEAEVAKLAMHYMLPKMAELSKDIKLRNFIHDSYIFSCPNDPVLYKQACEIIAESMQEAWKQMCQSVAIKDLPMPVNVRVGFNWGHIEKGEFIHELKVA